MPANDREPGTPTAASDREEWLTPAEVAALFGVHPKTVTRWAKSRRLTFIRTLGGHRRYRLSDVKRLLSEGPSPAE